MFFVKYKVLLQDWDTSSHILLIGNELFGVTIPDGILTWGLRAFLATISSDHLCRRWVANGSLVIKTPRLQLIVIGFKSCSIYSGFFSRTISIAYSREKIYLTKSWVRKLQWINELDYYCNWGIWMFIRECWEVQAFWFE